MKASRRLRETIRVMAFLAVMVILCVLYARGTPIDKELNAAPIAMWVYFSGVLALCALYALP